MDQFQKLEYLEKQNEEIIKSMHIFQKEQSTSEKAYIILNIIMNILTSIDLKDQNHVSQVLSDICKKLPMKTNLDQMVLQNLKFRVKKIISDISKESSNNNDTKTFIEELNTRKISQQMESRNQSMASEESDATHKTSIDSSTDGQKMDPKRMVQLINKDIEDLKLEIGNYVNSILENINDIISTNDTILIYGQSAGIDNFLQKQTSMQKDNDLTIFLCQCNGIGQKYQDSLIGHNEDLRKNVFIIEEVAADVYLRKCSKVIVACSAVMKNGNIISPIGASSVVISAKSQNIPVVVFTVSLKFALTDNADKLLEQGSPLDYLSQDMLQYCDCKVPMYDCIESSFISIQLTDMGAHPPFYILTLFKEIYGSDMNEQK